jgi:hypothetical protein
MVSGGLDGDTSFAFDAHAVERLRKVDANFFSLRIPIIDTSRIHHVNTSNDQSV